MKQGLIIDKFVKVNIYFYAHDVENDVPLTFEVCGFKVPLYNYNDNIECIDAYVGLCGYSDEQYNRKYDFGCISHNQFLRDCEEILEDIELLWKD